MRPLLQAVGLYNKKLSDNSQPGHPPTIGSPCRRERDAGCYPNSGHFVERGIDGELVVWHERRQGDLQCDQIPIHNLKANTKPTECKKIHN